MTIATHPAIQRFPARGGELTVGGVRLSLLAARVGRTPFYAYDRQLIDERVASAELRPGDAPPTRPRELVAGIHVRQLGRGSPLASVGLHLPPPVTPLVLGRRYMAMPPLTSRT